LGGRFLVGERCSGGSGNGEIRLFAVIVVLDLVHEGGKRGTFTRW